jgi:hypothetical protein
MCLVIQKKRKYLFETRTEAGAVAPFAKGSLSLLKFDIVDEFFILSSIDSIKTWTRNQQGNRTQQHFGMHLKRSRHDWLILRNLSYQKNIHNSSALFFVYSSLSSSISNRYRHRFMIHHAIPFAKSSFWCSCS